MPSGLPDSGLGVPGSWNGVDATDGYHYGQDSDAFTGSVNLFHVSGEPDMDPGDIWQFKIRLTVSSEPTNSIVFIEIRDENSNGVLARSAIPTYGGNETVLVTTIPTYEVKEESTSPASTSGRPDIRVNEVAGESGNWFVDYYAVRLRSGLDRTGYTQDKINASSSSFNSGQL